MHWVRFILLSTLFLFGCAVSTSDQRETMKLKMFEPGNHSLAVNIGKTERHYIVHVPKGYDGQSPVPVVMMFHGGGGTGRAAMRETGWTKKADECGFLAVFPEASRPDSSKPANFRYNPQTWNDGSGRFRSHVDDVGFISKLIEDLKTRFHIDSKRIFATGFSNGASMTYRLGIELSERIAAIAPVAGALWIEDPKPHRPVPLLYITGAQDPLNPIDGGIPRLAIGGRGLGGRSKPPVEEQIKKWARMLHCAKRPKVIHDHDGVIGIRYGSCEDMSEAIFYTVDGMGHTWPGGFSILPEAWVGKTSDKLKANNVIWEFFKGHPIP